MNSPFFTHTLVTNRVRRAMTSLAITGMLLLSYGVMAQTNIAPQATASASNCQGACTIFNDLAFGTCGTQLIWISTTQPPTTTPGVDFIDFVWTTPKTMNKMTI